MLGRSHTHFKSKRHYLEIYRIPPENSIVKEYVEDGSSGVLKSLPRRYNITKESKTAEDTHTERGKAVFDSDSSLTFEVVDNYVEKIVVNSTEDIKIEWREGRQQVLY